jgi:hypothetical protein
LECFVPLVNRLIPKFLCEKMVLLNGIMNISFYALQMGDSLIMTDYFKRLNINMVMCPEVFT